MEWQCLPSGRQIATSSCTEYPKGLGVDGGLCPISGSHFTLPPCSLFLLSLVHFIWQVECAAKCLLVPLSSANICVIRIFKPAPRNVFAKAQTTYTIHITAVMYTCSSHCFRQKNCVHLATINTSERLNQLLKWEWLKRSTIQLIVVNYKLYVKIKHKEIRQRFIIVKKFKCSIIRSLLKTSEQVSKRKGFVEHAR